MSIIHDEWDNYFLDDILRAFEDENYQDELITRQIERNEELFLRNLGKYKNNPFK